MYLSTSKYHIPPKKLQLDAMRNKVACPTARGRSESDVVKTARVRRRDAARRAHAAPSLPPPVKYKVQTRLDGGRRPSPSPLPGRGRAKGDPTKSAKEMILHTAEIFFLSSSAVRFAPGTFLCEGDALRHAPRSLAFKRSYKRSDNTISINL
ncbi:hypothetical protein EVAR_3330_1 [Eumeta japonica]|uniref:Uncharacterized protein n=1 Tax=Eumeta variegata TaxID=151549 RepID=A0A4C1SY64_EUMVA|nr:hypothetical protein EVAR_3330_1 [Eumeta japonica]